jgi:hypothetical protein
VVRKQDDLVGDVHERLLGGSLDVGGDVDASLVGGGSAEETRAHAHARGRVDRHRTDEGLALDEQVATETDNVLDIDERGDHYLRLAAANIVATEALLTTRDNLFDVLAPKAMMCVHGEAGLGKTLSVNASLRTLAAEDVYRVQFRARPTPRDIRCVLFGALGIGVSPPAAPIEFDALLKDVLAERFWMLVGDEAQWLSRECFEFWRHLY